MYVYLCILEMLCMYMYCLGNFLIVIFNVIYYDIDKY